MEVIDYYKRDFGEEPVKYKLILFDFINKRPSYNYSYCINHIIKNDLSGDIKKYMKDCGKIPRGTNICPASNLPVAADIYRRNYNIKRNVDTGDYNVFAGISPCRYTSPEFSYVYEKEKIILAYKGTNSATPLAELLEFVKSEYAVDLSTSSYKMQKYNSYYFLKDPNNNYKKLILGELKKPCILYKSLDLNGDNELNSDIILMILSTCDGYSQENLKNTKLLLTSLYQTNWREYPGTMTLFKRMLENSSAGNSIIRHIGSQTKPIKEILEYNFTDLFATDNDKQLATNIIKRLLNLDSNLKYVSTKELMDRLHTAKIPTGTFYQLFSTITKIECLYA